MVILSLPYSKNILKAREKMQMKKEHSLTYIKSVKNLKGYHFKSMTLQKKSLLNYVTLKPHTQKFKNLQKVNLKRASLLLNI